MLEYLNVQNVALISNVEIEFEKGLNVLTGETGAGKSILVDSIGLLLGGRCDKNLIRNGESQCKVTGKWNIENSNTAQINQFCNKYDFEPFDELIVTRTCTSEGKSQAKINGQPVTLSMLKELTSMLVDIYGQNENWTIFNSTNHLSILDAFAKIEQQTAFVEYKQNYETLTNINKSLKQFGGSDEDRLKTIDYLNYQIDEIENQKLSVEEYETLLADKKRLSNIGKIATQTSDSQIYLANTTIDNLSKAKSCIEYASQFDDCLKDYAERLNSASIEIQDILDSITDYNRSLDFSESEQQRVEDRLSIYNSMFRKYGKSVEEILQHLEKIKTERVLLLGATEEITKLQAQKSEVLEKLYNYAQKIHEIRENSGKELCSKVLINLQNLEIPNAKLSFYFAPISNIENNLQSNGMDTAELMFSANLGEPEKPLNKIASGGEISRFMLALKSVVANVDNMPAMIFDEIDTGISGNTSEAVAKQMAIISKEHQVIVITHSQHIASMADNNYFIYKAEKDGKTFTNIQKLDQQGKLKEVARFMSGSQITQSAIDNAKDMIEQQNKFKQNLKSNKF